MKNEPKIYKVKSVNQETGEDMENYVIANSIADIEAEYVDILSVEVLGTFDDLTKENEN